MDPGTGDYSVEAWFYYSGDNGLRSIVSKGNASESDDGFNIFLDGDQLVVRVHAGPFEAAASSVSMAAETPGWHHVTMVIDQQSGFGDSSITGYLNGSNTAWTPGYGTIGSDMFTQWGVGINVSNPLQIGAGAGFFDSEIADVRVWNRALTEDDVDDSMARVLDSDEPGLIAQWALDEGNGSVANDAVGGYDGALVNGPVWQDGDALTTVQDTMVRGRLDASDADGDALTFSVDGAAANGVASIDSSTGVWVYDPNPGYTGADSFSLQASDGHGGTDAVTVNVTIGP